MTEQDVDMPAVRDEWTLDCVLNARDDVAAPVDDTIRLINDLYETWFSPNTGIKDVIPRIFNNLDIRLRGDEDTLVWKHVQAKLKDAFNRLRRLMVWAAVHRIDEDPEIKARYNCILQALKMARFLLIENNIVCIKMCSGLQCTNPNVNDVLPVASDILGPRTSGGATIADPESAKLNSWQESFLMLRKILAGENFRRAGKMFLTRQVTKSGLETQAFQPVMEIADFINENTCYENNFEAWVTHTASAMNHETMIRYMSERPLPEAPDIEENCHLRSYEGDACGRGAVIYDGATDMAWPYAMRSFWPFMEKRVNEIRMKVYGSKFTHDSRYRVVAPTPDDVCVVHLTSTFPYDTFMDASELVQDNPQCLLQRCWYEADSFECSNMSYRVTNYRLEAYMQRTFVGFDEPAIWGRSWQRAVGTAYTAMQEVFVSHDTMSVLTDITRYPLADEFLRDNIPASLNENHFVRNSSGQVWIPLLSPGRKCRHRIDTDMWTALGGVQTRLQHRCFVMCKPYIGQRWVQVDEVPLGSSPLDIPNTVVDLLFTNIVDGESCLPEDVANTLSLTNTHHVVVYGVILVPVIHDATTRYFRVHTGHTWRDCNTPQFDKIYDSQKFGMHDKFMLWAQKGRTLFMVHEFDTYQITFVIIGYGGTGKSTIMIVMQRFWPSHLRGILSSNIEPKFGMSQVIKNGTTRAIFCNEVSEELQLIQEEWQTSCSGEEGSYAVKHGDAWVGVCKAHHLWVGNAHPKHWKNNNNQVSRRLAGVLMETPIQPRDGNVMDEINVTIGVVQRKMTLAYFDMVDQYGATDPMSQPTSLPPAFNRFYNNGRFLSNPVERYLHETLGSELVIDVNDPTCSMESRLFRDMYMAWRSSRNDLARIPQISADKYMPFLRERGVNEIKAKIVVEGGAVKTTELLTGIGIRGIPGPSFSHDAFI